MANPEHLQVVRHGAKAIYYWRTANPKTQLDLEEAKLDGIGLVHADLSGANLARAALSDANLAVADLSGAVLTDANLYRAHLYRANLSGANLSGAELSGTNLSDANLSKATMLGTHLTGATLIRANIEGATISSCRIYGVSAWDLVGTPSAMDNLIITAGGSPEISVDNLKVAQFLHLLLSNPEIRGIIDTVTSKVVLVLGRFTADRKPLLDALRNSLRSRNYVPVLFDFDRPRNRDTLETVRTLASMARFVIADLTDAKSVLQELQAIVPDLPSVPVQPLLLVSQAEPGMLDHFRAYPWFLTVVTYVSADALLANLDAAVIENAHAASQSTRAAAGKHMQ